MSSEKVMRAPPPAQAFACSSSVRGVAVAPPGRRMRRPLAPTKHCLECVTAACQPARYSSHRHVHDFGSLLVRESFNQYQAHDLPLLVGQPGQRALDRNDIRMLMTARIRNALAQLLRGKNPVAPASRPGFVDPGIAQNAEQPARDGRTG